MRTTLAVDDDVLEAARALARRQRRSVGKVLSELARQALVSKAAPRTRQGVPLFPLRSDAAPVTLDLVNRLRDDRE